MKESEIHAGDVREGMLIKVYNHYRKVVKVGRKTDTFIFIRVQKSANKHVFHQFRINQKIQIKIP